MSDEARTKRVVGIGGIFFKAADPKALGAWYEKHLGVPVTPYGHAKFGWRAEEDPSVRGATVWKPFPRETGYFAPSGSSFMVNYIVDDLDAVLAALRAEGVTVDEKREESPFGKFGWAMDPEGNRIELWEPPKK